MGAVTIGGRGLRVLEQHEPGSMRVERSLFRARAALVKAREGDDVEAIFDALVGMVFCYVGEPVNAGVTREWLADNLPANPQPIIRECVLASGQKLAEPAAGEAVRP